MKKNIFKSIIYILCVIILTVNCFIQTAFAETMTKATKATVTKKAADTTKATVTAKSPVTAKKITNPDLNGVWAEQALTLVMAKGKIEGVKINTKFIVSPNKAITRAEFAAIYARCKGLSLNTKNVQALKDVPKDAWYKSAVDKVTSNLIMTDITQGAFRPNQYITRSDAALLVTKTCKLETKENLNAFENLGKYTDVEETKPYYNSVMICKFKEILSGYTKTMFVPTGYLTRYEAVMLFSKLINPTLKPASTPQPTPKPVATTPLPTPTIDPIPVYANVGIIGNSIQGTRGKKVIFKVTGYGMTDLGTFDFKICFDPTKVLATNVYQGTIKPNDYLKGAGDIDLSKADSGFITINSSNNEKTALDRGIMFIIVFDILPKATGSTEITFKSKEGNEPIIKDTSGTGIKPLSIINGSITIN